MKITDSVYMLDCTPESHVYLLLGQEAVLVDTSMPGRGKRILAEINSLKIDPLAVKHILLTHHDGDHIGNAFMLQQATGAAVWASADDIPYIQRRKTRPGIKRFVSILLNVKPPAGLNAYPADNRIGEVAVIPTPGHTPGHVCLLFRGVLLAGDLVAARNGQIQPSPGIMTWNMPLVMESIKKVAPLSFEWVCPGHGMPVKRGDQWEKMLA